MSLFLFLIFTKNFPVTSIVDNEFINKTSFLSRLGLLYVVVQASKPKYYFAWTLGKMYEMFVFNTGTCFMFFLYIPGTSLAFAAADIIMKC